MKCPTCESCEYEQYCGATEIMRKCERHNKKVEQTNEEWFCRLSTEEKAKTIICLAVNSMNKKQKGLIENDVNEVIRWLKEKHNE